MAPGYVAFYPETIRGLIIYRLKYWMSVIAMIPVLPLMYYQGKRIRSAIPDLPEAKGEEGQVIAESDKVIRLITLGESTIAGVGVTTHKEGFSGKLAMALSKLLEVNVSWKVYAKSGFTASMAESVLVNGMRDKEVDLIVIGLGGNDAFKFHSPGKWKRDILRLMTSLRKEYPGVPVVFVNMPPIRHFPAFTPLLQRVIGGHVELLGKVLQDIVDPMKHTYYISKKITLDEWIIKYDEVSGVQDLFSDGVHPSGLTYEVWARETARYIADKEEIRKSLSL